MEETRDRCDEENCGHCVWHRNHDGSWDCTNPDSENFGENTEYNDACQEFEARRP